MLTAEYAADAEIFSEVRLSVLGHTPCRAWVARSVSAVKSALTYFLITTCFETALACGGR